MRRYKNWARKISSWEYLTIQRPVLPVLSWPQSASFLLFTLNTSRRCWRSAAAVAHDLILLEKECKQSRQGPICGWQFMHSLFLKLGQTHLSQLWFFRKHRHCDYFLHPSKCVQASGMLSPMSNSLVSLILVSLPKYFKEVEGVKFSKFTPWDKESNAQRRACRK